MWVTYIQLNKITFFPSKEFYRLSYNGICGCGNVLSTNKYFHHSKDEMISSYRPLFFPNSYTNNKVVNYYFNGCKRYFSTTPRRKAYDSTIFKYLSDSSITEKARQAVLTVHDFTGLPWWATIIVTTFLLRAFISLPLAIYQTNIMAKVENITLIEMPEIAKKVQEKTSLKTQQFHWSKLRASLFYKTALKKEWNTLIIRHNCHPFKASITLWFQIPTWVFFTSALRNMVYMLPFSDIDAQILYMKLSVGGFLWLPNLTQQDGSLILPIILGLSNLAIIEIQAMMRLREPTKIQKYATNFFRTFSLLLVPISATVPSILCLYWTTSSILGLLQNLLLMSNKVRTLCRIPDTPSRLDHPYHQLLHEIGQKPQSFLQIFKRK